MNFLAAFVIGGLICAIAQLIQDLLKLTPGHITAVFVSLGALLEFFDIYDHLIEVAGAGALVPITSFGHSLAHAAYTKAIETNYLGVLTGMFDKTAAGISLAIVLSVIVAIIFKPKN